jgi:hypothetical protein
MAYLRVVDELFLVFRPKASCVDDILEDLVDSARKPLNIREEREESISIGMTASQNLVA